MGLDQRMIVKANGVEVMDYEFRKVYQLHAFFGFTEEEYVGKRVMDKHAFAEVIKHMAKLYADWQVEYNKLASKYEGQGVRYYDLPQSEQKVLWNEGEFEQFLDFLARFNNGIKQAGDVSIEVTYVFDC
jgi:hypothetical protein